MKLPILAAAAAQSAVLNFTLSNPPPRLDVNTNPTHGQSHSYEDARMGNCSIIHDPPVARQWNSVPLNASTPLDFIWGESEVGTLSAYIVWGDNPNVTALVAEPTLRLTLAEGVQVNQTGQFCLPLNQTLFEGSPNGRKGTLAIIATTASGQTRSRCSDIVLDRDAAISEEATAMCKRSVSLGEETKSGSSGAERAGWTASGWTVAAVAAAAVLLAV